MGYAVKSGPISFNVRLPTRKAKHTNMRPWFIADRSGVWKRMLGQTLLERC
jgi:hypothetical protein